MGGGGGGGLGLYITVSHYKPCTVSHQNANIRKPTMLYLTKLAKIVKYNQRLFLFSYSLNGGGGGGLLSFLSAPFHYNSKVFLVSHNVVSDS